METTSSFVEGKLNQSMPHFSLKISVRYAKMWYKGVSFTSEQCALVYLVDAAGTRTTTDSFSDMSQVIDAIKSRVLTSLILFPNRRTFL